MLYQENILAAKKALDELLILLSQITDTVFFCQLASSVLMYSASRCLFFSALNATELLLKLRTLTSTGDMLQIIVPKLHEIFDKYHKGETKKGSISVRIDEFVQNNLSDCNLSLKWIAENHLYMNIDYVSKRFMKETAGLILTRARANLTPNCSGGVTIPAKGFTE